jgi:hypothetical protein
VQKRKRKITQVLMQAITTVKTMMTAMAAKHRGDSVGVLAAVMT